MAAGNNKLSPYSVHVINLGVSHFDKKYALGIIIYHGMWLLDLLLNAYTCPSIRDEVLLCKVIYEIIENKESLTQIKMSVRVIAVLLLIKMIRITAHNKCKKWAVLRPELQRYKICHILPCLLKTYFELM